MKRTNESTRSLYQPCLRIKQCGFTLIEILISTAIAALIMSGLIGVIGLTLNADATYGGCSKWVTTTYVTTGR